MAVGLADDPEIDQILYTALAKGADAAVKLADASGAGSPGPAGIRIADRAALLAGYLAAQPADLVISGVQAADDLDGQLPPTLAALLDLPHVSVAVSVEVDGGSVIVRQEFAGGRSHELQVRMPAVIGVQSARQAPRYAPITRIRQAMQAGGLTEMAVSPRAAGDRRWSCAGCTDRRRAARPRCSRAAPAMWRIRSWACFARVAW